MASRFVVAVGDVRDKLYQDAELFLRATGEKYKYYLKVMEKLSNGTEEWLEKETTRWVPLILCVPKRIRNWLSVFADRGLCFFLSSRLASILKKRNVSPQKLDEVKIKANILSSFKAVEEKAEQVVEQAAEKLEEAVGRATAEL